MSDSFREAPGLRPQDALPPPSRSLAEVQAPMLVEAEWPPHEDRVRAAGHVDFNLVRHVATEVINPLDRDQAEWAVGALLDAARTDPHDGRRDALLLALASRLAHGVGWQVTPKPPEGVQ